MLNKYLILFSIVLLSCQNNSNYDKLVREEMKKGEYIDSIQFGLKFGDTKKDFFVKSWELNNEGKVTHGPNNDFIAYELENMPEGKRVNHLFYATFEEDDILSGLDMRFYFLGWAPWNQSLQSEYVLPIAMDKLMEWYPGNEFIPVDNIDIKQDAYVKIDGNREIIIHTMDEKNVRAKLTDLRVKYPNLAK
tara:strand:+ start:10643 stop:11215 length:573 start_codon:yes stop_codon:yes gene_type:complete